MKKISETLENCNDCKHCQLFLDENSNHSSAAICTNDDLDQPILLIHSSVDKNVKDRYKIDIPNNCPLETYKE